jgi:hypothetical protein
MAGIDRTDAIKRPTDSTLAPRTLDRGSEAVVRVPADGIESLRPSLPALAVVVEQTVMGSRDKPLYDLVLSLNQQWVRVQSERAFPPGTVLMVEATPENQLRVLPQVDQTQLNRMMQASLQFWQAHSLPKVHATQMPALPAPAVLQSMTVDAPELQALVQWLSQKPGLSPRAVAQWMQEFSPLARLQPALSGLPNAPLSPATASLEGAQQAATTPANATASLQTLALAPLLRSVARANTIQITQAAAQTPTLQPGQAVLLTPLPAGAPVLPASATLLSAAAVQGLSAQSSSTASLTPGTLLIPSADSSSLLPRLAILAPQQGSQLQSSPMAIQPGSANSATPTLASATSTGTTTGQTPAGTTTPTQSGTVPAGSNQSASPQALLALQNNFGSLPSPPDGGSKTDAGKLETIPMEIRLTQWLAVLDSRIRQHPASLQQALAQQAQRLLNTPSPGYAPGVSIQSPGGAAPLAQDDLQPLLQLRALLEGLQGKTQNNAIQQALGSLAQPDAPPVQQLSIPMIWLGPNHWLNMEWWQERPDTDDGEADTSAQRKFRFRLFFELPPLAPLCADLHWSPEHTDVIFWSQDQGTLGIINRHLDTLEQWTQGLGERELLTRHGMPPKKTTPEPDQFKPLVDVRT